MATILKEIDAIWEERAKGRKSFLELLLDNLPSACEPAGEWFDKEIEFAEKVLKVLQNFDLLEETKDKEEKLKSSREKFERAFKNLQRLIERVKKGEVPPLGVLAEGKGKGVKGASMLIARPITRAESEEEQISDALGMIMDMFSAATEFEALLSEMDTELKKLKKLSLVLPQLLER